MVAAWQEHTLILCTDEKNVEISELLDVVYWCIIWWGRGGRKIDPLITVI